MKHFIYYCLLQLSQVRLSSKATSRSLYIIKLHFRILYTHTTNIGGVCMYVTFLVVVAHQMHVMAHAIQ